MTNESSSKKFEICLKIDSNTQKNEFKNEIETKTKKQIAEAKDGIKSVNEITIARSNLIVKNYR